MKSSSVLFAVFLLGLTLSHIAALLLGGYVGFRRRQFTDAELVNYGYSLGWNQGLSMTEIPGAEIIDLSTGTKRVVPRE